MRLLPTPMKHVRLLVLTEDLPRLSLALAEMACLHPDRRPPEAQGLDDAPARSFREVYRLARSRLDKIARLVPFDPPAALEPLHAVEQEELERLNDWLGEIWEQASGYEEAFRQIAERERLIQEQRAALQDFAELNIDLKLLRAQTRFLRIDIGLVPRENLRQLSDAVSLAGYLLHVYLRRREQVHVAIIGPREPEKAGLNGLLNAAGFQPLPIPEGLDRTPAELERDFKERLAALRDERAYLQKSLRDWSETLRVRLSEAERLLCLAEPFAGLEEAARARGHLSYLAGWVPADRVPELRRRLDAALGSGAYDLDVRDPRPDERHLVPTVTPAHPLLAPFGMLVRQYGVPAYGEIDPTPLFAASFLLMFGSMFGDLGQGVIALAAYGLRQRFERLWRFGLMAGLSSMFFGLLYGSVFGYEGILPALWMSPLEDPLLMLRLALGWGVFFIVGACLIAIYNRLAIGEWRRAIFGQHGALNLAFYLALIAGALQMAEGRGFGTFQGLLALSSLAGLTWETWRHQPQAPLGERVLVVAIETLETLISYVSNTLSFLRVAAFSLNHVALSIAVFTLADMMGAFGSALTIVLGNLFILVLEGGIVMIQVMRLEYYEGFSRYFSGSGIGFDPVRLEARLSG